MTTVTPIEPLTQDVATGNVIRKFRGHELKINSVRFAAEGSSVIVSGSYDKTVRFFDCRSRSLDPIQTVDCARDSVTSLAVSGHEVLFGSMDGHARILDIRRGVRTDDCVGEGLTCVGFTRDANCLLASAVDSKVRLLDKGNGELLQSYTGHKHASYKVETCMTQGDQLVVAGSEDGRIVFWDLVEGKVLHTLAGHKHVVTALAYHPTDNALLSSSVDGKVIYWT